MISKRTNDLLALSLIFFYALIAVIRLYPYHNEFAEIMNGPLDDWKMYAQTASDIHHNGLSIPSVSGNYNYPNGFLYNYFLAFCFSIFGENTIPVYIIQSLFLGVTIFFSYRTFRERIKPLFGLFFLIFFFFFGLLDMNKYYSFRFLSENLIILLLAMFFYNFKKATEDQRWHSYIFSGLLLGLSILTRPNLLPVVLVIVSIITFFGVQKKIKTSSYLLFVSSLLISMSLLAFRNFYVTGSPTFFPINSFTFFKLYFTHPDILIENIWSKFLFTFGFVNSINPVSQWRPHWTILWLLYLTFITLKFIRKERSESWEKIMHLFILTYSGMMIFVIDTNLITCYGFRYIIPLIFTVFPFSLLATERIFSNGKNKLNNKINA